MVRSVSAEVSQCPPVDMSRSKGSRKGWHPTANMPHNAASLWRCGDKASARDTDRPDTKRSGAWAVKPVTE